MKCFIRVLLILTLLFGLGIGSSTAAEQVAIGVSQIVEHPALDADRQGFMDTLKEHGYVEGKNVVYDVRIAQGNMATANSIAKELVGKKVNLIYTIATPTSQACVNATKTIPIVFSSVTDPLEAGLVKDLKHPGGNVTGMMDRSPVDHQMELILKIVPKLKKLGVIYNPGEDNSQTSLKQLREIAQKKNIEIVEATANNSSGVFMAAKTLVGRVDGIHIPTDNTVVSAFESVVKVCEENKIPLFAADVDSVSRGAIAALAIDYYRLGRQAGEVAVRVLKGEAPGTIPVETLKDLKLWINKKSAAKMGVSLPEAVLKQADKTL